VKFLEASRRVHASNPSKHINLLVASSANLANLDIYLKAEFVERDFRCHVDYLPFNTLPQYLVAPAVNTEQQILILFPWDFLPELDWRTGITESEPDFDECLTRLDEFEQLVSESNHLCVYVDAPTPPVFISLEKDKSIKRKLRQSANGLCYVLFDADVFNLGSYLESGIPLSGKACGLIAAKITKKLNLENQIACKILVTDLDNVMWHGVIAEDGYQAIQCSPSGRGYTHFIYQTYLKKLKHSGVLLAAVSKNDPDLALLPFVKNEMVLNDSDFVTIQASYHPKSNQIKQISKELNLNVGDFVFVDDNRLEIEEVKRAIPDIKTVLFPESSQYIGAFYAELTQNFNIQQVTTEDQNRTSLYRTRLAGLTSSDSQGSDLTQFLQKLNMTITINIRSHGKNERALQLFNKTNQFNINGIRLERDELDQKLISGYTLYTAGVSDRYGDHGEILACLLDDKKNIEMLVLSCRVFQRRIEYFFLRWLSTQLKPQIKHRLQLLYRETERNTPVRHFFDENAIDYSGEMVSIDMTKVLNDIPDLDSLFKLMPID